MDFIYSDRYASRVCINTFCTDLMAMTEHVWLKLYLRVVLGLLALGIFDPVLNELSAVLLVEYPTVDVHLKQGHKSMLGEQR